MALQVWLPLKKDILNRGLASGVTVTPNGGTTAFAAGMAGQALTANGSTYWTISPITLGAKASFSFWAKTSDTNAMLFVINATMPNLNFWRANNKYYLNKGDSYNNPFQNNGADVAWHSDAWHHYVLTFDGTQCLLYVDGAYHAKAKTYASPATPANSSIRLMGGFNNTHSYDTQGLIYDFRVHDECITLDDVRDLYLNKVLEITPQWLNDSRLYDASGLQYPLTPSNLAVANNLIQFNGSTSYIGFTSPNITGGTVSMWVNIPAKPNAQRFLYYDPVSKMSIQFSNDGNIHLGGDGSSQSRYATTGITWGQMTHIVGVWNSSRKPSAIYINGVKPSTTGNATTWTTGGTACAIGRRLNAATVDNFSGSVNEVKVFTSQLTAADVKMLYSGSSCPNIWGELPSLPGVYLSYSGCSWMKILHHNNPASNLFTAANGKNNNEPDLFSKLGLFDSNTNFRMSNNRYEFMVREKLESTHTESAATWVQTSSPTASTISGYQLLTSSPGNPPRTFGLCHQSANAVFDISTQDWWCACGCNTAYQGGIPGFYGVVKSGYIDLYARVDDTKYLGAAEVPNGYTVLQYIEANGTQWIDTELSGFDTEDWEIFCEWKLSAAPAGTYAVVFGVYEAEANNSYRLITNQKSTTDYYVSPDSKAGGGSISVTGLASASTHTVLIKGKGSFLVNGTAYSAGTFGTPLSTGNTMGLFRTKTSGGSFTNFFKGRIYAFWAKKGGVYKCNLVPAKRNSDSVVGMYDVVRNRFLVNTGTGTFTAGAAVTNL